MQTFNITVCQAYHCYIGTSVGIPPLCSQHVQSMDALDGKQGRYIKFSDTITELFDHGCDSMSNILVLLCLGSAFGLSDYPNMCLALMALQLSVFYCYHWQCYATERMKFRW